MTVSRLLKSWATPPARRPIASIFCACRSCSSSCASGGLGLIPRRDVDAEADDVWRAVDIQAPAGEVEMARLRACADKAAGLDLAGASRVDLLDRGGHADAVVGMNSAERLGIQDAPLGHAEQDLVGLVPADVAAVPVEYEENAGYGINDVLGECLLAAQRLFGALALGDIAHHH
jgi:hypothetical protein